MTWVGAPLWDVDGVHAILREWRAIATATTVTGCTSARWWSTERSGWPLHAARRVAHHLQPRLPEESARPTRLRQTIEETLAAFGTVGAPATWPCPTTTRPSCHPLRPGVHRRTAAPAVAVPSSDRALGTRRARAMLLLLLALPGSVYLYQGEDSASGRWRTWPTCTSPPGVGELPAHHPGAGRLPGTAAGSGPRRRSGSLRVRRGCPSRRGGATTPPRPRRADPPRCCTSIGRHSPPPGPERGRGPGLTGWRGRRGCSHSPGQLRLHPQPVRGPHPGDRTGAAGQRAVVDGLLPPQSAAWTSGLPGVDQAAQYTVYEGR